MNFFTISLPIPTERAALNTAYRMNEAQCVEHLLAALQFTSAMEQAADERARALVTAVREQEKERSGIEALMAHYDLSTAEGILLMCLAEALLRVPDKKTKKLLIQDKLTSASWERHIGASESSFVNMATWGLALSGKILTDKQTGSFTDVWHGLIRRSGEPVIRKAVHEAMKVLSETFVLGRDIPEALKHSSKQLKQGYRYSYDMLGEVARTQKDADKYFTAYHDAISLLGKSHQERDIFAAPCISIKLSALHPRYEYRERDIIMPALIQRTKQLVVHAKANHLSVTIDAEEAELLDLSLDIFTSLFSDADFSGWHGLGLAVQAYQKRALPLIDWLIELARRVKRRIPVRLVKGAYWDTEIKRTQMEGLNDYPVFTRKINTDISYLACAKRLLSAQDAIYPQFATHNAYSVAAILTILGDDYHRYEFEFQNLQGMGKALHDHIVHKDKLGLPCRIYAPVGSHEDLLPYLVRRLLENGANSSFVNRIADKNTPLADLVVSPLKKLRSLPDIANSKIPLPLDLFATERVNSRGIDLSNLRVLKNLADEMEVAAQKNWQAAPFNRAVSQGEPVLNPADSRQQIGVVEQATSADVEQALDNATAAFPNWDGCGVAQRAALLRKVADLLEEHRAELMYLAVREGGRTLPNVLSELREATDFCRYYACNAEKHLAPITLPGYTGETNILQTHGRGVFLCVSPWKFPIAIFTGQVAATLVAGNTVIAKPAHQTPLTAALVVKLFHAAGVPEHVLQLLPGPGSVVGAALVANPRVNGVLLTGSNATARAIQLAMAQRSGPIGTLVAETGGVNAMIVDSTALPEQVVRDVIISAFDSAGQRCSALRVLYVQDDIADHLIEMLAGAMAEIRVGDPLLLSTDVGPVIDVKSQKMLQDHANELQQQAKLIYKVELPPDTQHGIFVAPQAYELPDLTLCREEFFGPILHVIRYRSADLDQVIADINGLGYGLTFGIQSRIDERVRYIQERIKVGNIYVNRNMVGAVVGVQPFGGSRLSGTGPKAGGPHYLTRLCDETTLTIDTTAAGGNASLMAMED